MHSCCRLFSTFSLCFQYNRIFYHDLSLVFHNRFPFQNNYKVFLRNHHQTFYLQIHHCLSFLSLHSYRLFLVFLSLLYPLFLQMFNFRFACYLSRGASYDCRLCLGIPPAGHAICCQKKVTARLSLSRQYPWPSGLTSTAQTS